MNPFISISVLPDYRTGHRVMWKIDPTFHDDGNYVFTLEVSDTPDFSEIIFTKIAETEFFAIDNSGLKRNMSDGYYFRVKLVTGDDTYYSKMIALGADKVSKDRYLKAAEITRKELLLMDKKNGAVGKLLKRKSYGPKADNLDPVSGVPLTDESTDYGTGLVGGYHNPLTFMYKRVQVDQITKRDPSGNGVTENESLKIRTIGFPLIEEKDIIVTNSNERYICLTTKYTYYPGTDIKLIQILDLSLIQSTDVVYKIEV